MIVLGQVVDNHVKYQIYRVAAQFVGLGQADVQKQSPVGVEVQLEGLVLQIFVVDEFRQRGFVFVGENLRGDLYADDRENAFVRDDDCGSC